MSALSSYLQVEDILLGLQVSSRPQLFEEIGRHVERAHVLTADTVVSALLRREEAGSTAMGQGVVIPHASVKDLDRIRILYIRLTPALAFDAPDGKPVSDVLVLIVPGPAAQTHLEILAQASSLFLQDGFREALHRCESPAQVKDVFDRWAR